MKEIVYLKPGGKGTAHLIEAVADRVRESGISHVVVASTKGKTALRLAEALKGIAEVVSVTEFTYEDEVKKRMKKLGVTAIEKADLPIQDRREMRETLLIFGAGVKAALEVAAVAAEKGVAPAGKVVAVAGSRGGLDTALIVRPAP
ncbi:MAG: pyruvate kinase alpha/beta domain-containing protein, partial [Candidatus Bathyarchaeia archaeon]